jgi:hypothetical protein
MKAFSINESIGIGWSKVKQHLGLVIATALVYFIASFIPQILQNILVATFSQSQSQNSMGLMVIAFIIAFSGIILSLVLSIGYIRFSLNVVDGKKANVADLFSTNPKEILRYFLASLLAVVFIVVVFLISFVPGFVAMQLLQLEEIGILLFLVGILPAIYFSLSIVLFSYYIVDQGLNPIDSLKKSMTAMKGNKLYYFFFVIVLGLINLLGVLALFIGLLITMPLAWIATAHAYRKLSATTAQKEPTTSNNTPQASTTTPQPPTASTASQPKK